MNKRRWRGRVLEWLRKKIGDPITDERLQHIELAVANLGAQITREERESLGAHAAKPIADPAPSPGGLLTSQPCRGEAFGEPYFLYWTQALQFHLRYHRKVWEFAYICQALSERGMLAAGKKGLGFGVGREPLPSLFAKMGCFVLGTDMAPDGASAAGWSDTRQHAADKWQLYKEKICDRALFDARVSYRSVDMNHVPADLKDFDFCWSACAFEHLGSIEAGLAFVEASIGCLAPGGIAVHTTELNLSSNDDTLKAGPTVLFRQRDFLSLAERLRAKGDTVEPLDFTTGRMAVDSYVDIPPYRVDPHLRLALSGYATTSFGLIVRKGSA